jgi:hypothetical protein
MQRRSVLFILLSFFILTAPTLTDMRCRQPHPSLSQVRLSFHHLDLRRPVGHCHRKARSRLAGRVSVDSLEISLCLMSVSSSSNVNFDPTIFKSKQVTWLYVSIHVSSGLQSLNKMSRTGARRTHQRTKTSSFMLCNGVMPVHQPSPRTSHLAKLLAFLAITSRIIAVSQCALSTRETLADLDR